MNKKIISILSLFIILVATAITFSHFNQSTTDTQDSSSYNDATDEQIDEEIDDSFLDEDDEIEIGEMV